MQTSVSSVSVLTEGTTSTDAKCPPIIRIRDADQKPFDAQQIYQQTVRTFSLNIDSFEIDIDLSQSRLLFS